MGAARQSACVVCWRWCHLLHGVNVALRAPDHPESCGFVAKLTRAKQVNPAFCLGCTQGQELTGMDKQPWMALMTRALNMLLKATQHAVTAQLGAAVGVGAHVASSPSSFLQRSFTARVGRHELEFLVGCSRNALPEVAGSG